MIATVRKCLTDLRFGEIQHHRKMDIFPIFCEGEGNIAYITLGEALENGDLSITEKDEGATVPELKVINRGGKPVLLLDGEELVGAKQNRVLNTTILLKERSQTIIPVSCTEAGRWSSVSREFGDSGAVANLSVRTRKVASVSRHLSATKSYRSDQGAVWDEIERTRERAKAHAPTSALRDVYKSKDLELEGYLDAFPCKKGQKGIIAAICGHIVGMDYISSAAAYAKTHPKLVKSYAMDALLETRPSRKASRRKAEEFLHRIPKSSEEKFRSVGYGWDYRYTSRDIVGSALVYNREVIHLAFFADSEGTKVNDLVRSSRRRNFRR